MGSTIAQLEEQLTQSGRQARLTSAGGMPSAVYAAELRERLVARLETQRPPLFPFAWGQKIARVVPVSIAALLFAVAVVGASQLNIGSTDPSPSPVAATDDASPSQPTDPSLEPIPTDGLPIVPVASPSPGRRPPPRPPRPRRRLRPRPRLHPRRLRLRRHLRHRPARRP